MKRKLYLLPILLLCLSIARLFGQCGQIVWQDEFNGSAVDNTKWNFSTGGGGWGNFELQTYTNSSNNVRIENGRLVIEAINSNGNYTSARLNTRGKFDRRYGKFEIRAKLPTGTGLWPAFWLLPETTVGWPMSGEIDIMENRGDQPNVNHGTLHYGAGGSDALRRFDGTSYTLPSGNFADSYHTFSVEWEYGVIRWYVDGNLYKTETRSPNSLSQGTTGDPWPWDSYNYYLIVNLAVGGPATPFTGRQNPNFGTSGKLEVEYVRVYSSPQPQIVITGKNRVFQNSVATYSVPTSPGQTYLWTVPVGATITAGQNTNQVTVNWGTLTSANIGVRITHGAGASCPGNSFDYTREVTIYKNECNFLYHNFQGYSTMNAGIAPGVLSEQNNPAPNVVNNSPRVGRYVRNGSQQYDALFYNDALLNPGTDYSSGTYVIKMDVYTAAPVGTAIDIQLGNAAAWGAYPAGIHSSYTAATAAVNQWHTVTFSFAAFVDPNRAAFQNNLDRLVFLFQPNAYTNTTFFIDNIRRELVPSAPTLTINGLNAVANNQTGVAYTATGGNAGNQYLWSTPVGSTIASGANTNAISVNYGVLGGIVSVQERVAAGCYGPVATRSISVGGSSCALFSDEFDNNNTGTWIANSAGSGFIHSEAITDWKVNSPGYGEWAYFEYTINDGTNPVLLDFTNPVNNPVMKIRARASSSLMMSVTLVDNAGMAAANQYLTPLNSLILNSTSQEYTIDFNGQFWDQYGTPGGTLDQSRIAKIRIAFNPGFASFPYANPAGGTFNSAFIGDVFIDYIRIGNDCATALANFSASDFVLCGTTSSVTYTDNSSNTNTSTTYAWNFGAGATPATATTRGPHNVTYSTSGPKTVTLTLNGTVTRERQNYVYVSPASPGGCVFQDEYDNNTVSALTAAQGNFTFTENTNQFHISTTAHGEWETFSQGIEAAGALRPVDFACAGTPAVIKVRAKASSPVALRLNLADVNNRSTNNAATVAQTMVLSTTFQEFTLNFGGRFFDQYSNGGPFQLDSTNITRMMFAVNPGFSSFPWNGFNASFNGTIDIDYIQIGTCAGSPEINVIQAANTILTNGTYSFAAQNVNTASAAVTFTIQNTGNAALNLTGTPRIAISGANAADFTITQPAVSSIAAGANTTFTVVFNPSAAGARTAQLSIANDDNTGAENPYIIVLNGTGNCPTITTANAGADQTVCAATATLAGNVPTTGTGTWSVVSGTATIANPTSANSGVTGLGTGAATLRWTISLASCTPSTDDVVITRNAAPTAANAGADQTVCATTATLAGNAPAVGTGTWSVVSGTATITTPTSPTSGLTAIGAGAVTLRWTVSNAPCVASTDDVVITRNAAPTAANAGADQSVCATTATLAANAPVVGTGTWSVVSGTATIANANSPTSGLTTIGVGAVTLRWTISNAPCAASTDDVVITRLAAPTIANAGSDQSVCATTATLAANAPAVGTGTWSVVSGTATIANANSPTSGLTAIGVGSVTLRWTISNGVCTPSTDEVVITRNAAPTVANAGADQSVCANSANLSANAPTVGTGVWSVITGTATITNPSSATTSVTGLGAGSVTLRWTISNAPCAASTDDVVITNTGGLTTANAGADQTICATTATLSANAAGAGNTGTWSVVSGTATITNANSPTSGLTAIGVGSVTLRWTISNGVCTPSTDEVVITRNAAPTVANAGADQSVCANSANLSANAPSVGTGVWSVITGTATITNPSSATTSVTGLGAGSVTLRWTISNAPCAASTDDVVITNTGGLTTANAGADQTICATTATLSANAAGAGNTGTWSVVSGTATISNANSPTSGLTAIGVGSVTLRWTISNGVCTPSTDEVVITRNAAPTVANAGADQSVCANSANLSANAPSVGTGVWSVVTGTATITNPSSATTSVTGLGAGSVTLRWTISNAPCAASTDDVVITNTGGLTTANAGADQNVCGATATMSANAAGAGNTGTWSVVSGTATITNANSPTTAVNFTAGTAVTLRWTISNGVCAPSTDEVTINSSAAPTAANAGADISICSNANIVLSANTPSVGTGVWTVTSGTGTFADANAASTAVSGAGASNTYTWTISNGVCPPSSDAVQVNVTTFVAANAGADQAITPGSVNLSASPTNGMWSTTSAGVSFSPNATTASAVASGLTVAGSPYTFTWTVAANGPCAASSDNMTVTVTAAPAPNISVTVGGTAWSNTNTFAFTNHQQVGESSVPVSVTISNTGTGVLNVSSITLNGVDFVISGANAPVAIAPTGIPVSFSVSFNPQSTGFKTGSIQINSNDGDEASFLINLNGNGITDVSEAFASQIQVSPNPAIDQVMIQLNEGQLTEVMLRDLNGRLLLTTTGMGQIELNLSEFAQGVYSLEIVQGENKAVKKIVKQ